MPDPAFEALRYPIGAFVLPKATPAAARAAWIADLAQAPLQLRAAAAGLTDAQLDTPYRPGGWTLRQVIHHLPDSHLNAYTRLKLAITENHPTIRPYDEQAWAECEEARTADPELSLALFEALHRRWVCWLETLPDAAFGRTLRHPEHDAVFTVGQMLANYAWHSRHHIAHLTTTRARMGGA